MTIRQRRKELNLTQKQLSYKTGIVQCTISKYENGKLQIKKDAMIKLAEALDTDVQTLFFLSERSKKQMNESKIDYSMEVLEVRENYPFLDFATSKEDAQLIADVINILANSQNSMSISRAQKILEDAIKILPMIVAI